MTILLTGWGLLAQAVAHVAFVRSAVVHAVSRRAGIGAGWPIDLTRPGTDLAQVLHESRPDVLIHTAAATSLVGCERDPGGAFRANVIATANVLEASYSAGVPVAFLSTDGVFDGRRGQYREDDPRAPLNVYGLTKSHAEDLVLARDGLVVRATYVGRRPDGSRGLIEGLLDRRVRPHIPEGKRGSPLWVGHAAEALLDLTAKGTRGPIHLGSADTIGWRELAQSIRGEPVDEARADDGVLRPRDTSLDVSRAQEILDHTLPSAAQTVRAMLAAPPLSLDAT